MAKKAYDIQWDTDGIDIDLPGEVVLPDDVSDDGIADYLSDKYGYCVFGFRTGDTEAKVQVYKVEHIYRATVTHELTYTLPAGLSDADALKYIQDNGVRPDSEESTDEDFNDDVEWTVLDKWDD